MPGTLNQTVMIRQFKLKRKKPFSLWIQWLIIEAWIWQLLQWGRDILNVAVRIEMLQHVSRDRASLQAGDTRITQRKNKSWEQVGWQIDDEYSLLLPYPSWLLLTRGNVLSSSWPRRDLGLTSDDAGLGSGGRLGTNTWWLQPSVVFHRSHSQHLPAR